MRRLSAYFALSVIWAGVLNPFLAAAQSSTIHACCLRTGLHHCQRPSSEAGFHAPRGNCPYSTPFVSAAFTGLESAKVNLSAPALTGLVAPTPLARAYAAEVHAWSARGPPLFL